MKVRILTSCFIFFAGNLLSVGCSSVYAFENGRVGTWTIGNKDVLFVLMGKENLMIELGCDRADSKCEARQALSQATLKTPPSPFLGVGAPSPGSRICLALKGGVVLGVDRQRNERTFCRFKDQTHVDNGALVYMAHLNDNRTQTESK